MKKTLLFMLCALFSTTTTQPIPMHKISPKIILQHIEMLKELKRYCTKNKCVLQPSHIQTDPKSVKELKAYFTKHPLGPQPLPMEIQTNQILWNKQKLQYQKKKRRLLKTALILGIGGAALKIVHKNWGIKNSIDTIFYPLDVFFGSIGKKIHSFYPLNTIFETIDQKLGNGIDHLYRRWYYPNG